MRSNSPTATASPPRGYNYSLDWRFLLPMADPQKICLLFEEDLDFSQTLERAGIHASQQLSLADFRDHPNDRFQLFVMPFGLPRGWAGTRQEDHIQFYFSIRQFIGSGGHFLVGFNNALNLDARPPKKYHSSTSGHLAHELRQAGFKSVRIFGAMPDLKIPEYIFDLDPRAVQFALQNRFRRKPAILRGLGALAGVIGWKRMSNLLPCYFAMGTA